MCGSFSNLQSCKPFKLVHYEAQTVGKRAVCIRLKCLLVQHDSVKYWTMLHSLTSDPGSH